MPVGYDVTTGANEKSGALRRLNLIRDVRCVFVFIVRRKESAAEYFCCVDGMFGHDIDKGLLGFFSDTDKSSLRDCLIEVRCTRVDCWPGLLAGNGYRQDQLDDHDASDQT